MNNELSKAALALAEGVRRANEDPAGVIGAETFAAHRETVAELEADDRRRKHKMDEGLRKKIEDLVSRVHNDNDQHGGLVTVSTIRAADEVMAALRDMDRRAENMTSGS